MSTSGAIAAAGAGLTGTGGIVAAALGGSPWPLLVGLAVVGVVVVVLGIVVLTAARTDSETRHRHAHEVLRTLVFAARGEHPRPLPWTSPDTARDAGGTNGPPSVAEAR